MNANNNMDALNNEAGHRIINHICGVAAYLSSPPSGDDQFFDYWPAMMRILTLCSERITNCDPANEEPINIEPRHDPFNIVCTDDTVAIKKYLIENCYVTFD